jgi:rhodanese-related sulfurtransferase
MGDEKFTKTCEIISNVRALIGFWQRRAGRWLAVVGAVQGWALSRFLLIVLGLVQPMTGCESMFQNKITDDKVQLISVAELSKLYQDAAREEDLLILLDPRPLKAFEGGHIPGAQHLPLTKLPVNAERDNSIARYRHIVVYGDNPATPTAIALVKRLLGSKYEGVRLYAGGLSEWATRGFPTDGTRQPLPSSETPVESPR